MSVDHANADRLPGWMPRQRSAPPSRCYGDGGVRWRDLLSFAYRVIRKRFMANTMLLQLDTSVNPPCGSFRWYKRPRSRRYSIRNYRRVINVLTKLFVGMKICFKEVAQ